jgi:hypothetical protein
MKNKKIIGMGTSMLEFVRQCLYHPHRLHCSIVRVALTIIVGSCQQVTLIAASLELHDTETELSLF